MIEYSILYSAISTLYTVLWLNTLSCTLSYLLHTLYYDWTLIMYSDISTINSAWTVYTALCPLYYIHCTLIKYSILYSVLDTLFKRKTLPGPPPPPPPPSLCHIKKHWHWVASCSWLASPSCNRVASPSCNQVASPIIFPNVNNVNNTKQFLKDCDNIYLSLPNTWLTLRIQESHLLGPHQFTINV